MDLFNYNPSPEDNITIDNNREKGSGQSFVGKKTAGKSKKPVARLKFLKPCPICGGKDFIHGRGGGFFCVTCQPGKTGEPVFALGHRSGKRGGAEQSSVHQRRKTEFRPVSSRGVAWIQDHLPKLLAAGWTRADLFRRSRRSWPGGSGVVFLPVWERDDLQVEIDRSTGRIVFSYLDNAGRAVVLSAYPADFVQEKVK